MFNVLFYYLLNTVTDCYENFDYYGQDYAKKLLQFLYISEFLKINAYFILEGENGENHCGLILYRGVKLKAIMEGDFVSLTYVFLNIYNLFSPHFEQRIGPVLTKLTEGFGWAENDNFLQFSD